jgi:hypothetical protein
MNLICARYEIEDKYLSFRNSAVAECPESPPKTFGLISGVFLNRSTPALAGQRFFLKIMIRNGDIHQKSTLSPNVSNCLFLWNVCRSDIY